MPNDSFVPVKTLAEEQAATEHVDATSDQVEPGQTPPDTSHTPTAPTSTPDSMKAPIERGANGAALTTHDVLPTAAERQRTLGEDVHVGTEHADPTDAGDLIKSGSKGLRKLADAQDAVSAKSHDGDRVVSAEDAGLTKDELAGVRYLKEQHETLAEAEKKAKDEGSVPTVLKPLVAAGKGVGLALENTGRALDVPEVGNNAESIPQVGGTTGEVIQGAAQFATDFVLAGKATRGLALLRASAGLTNVVKAGAADALAFDPHQVRLSDIVQANVQAHPWLRNPLTQYLASDPEDSDAEGRFKNAIEGFAVGKALDLFMGTAKALKGVVSAAPEDADAALVAHGAELEKGLDPVAPAEPVATATPEAPAGTPTSNLPSTQVTPEGAVAGGPIPVLKDSAGNTSGNTLEDAVKDYLKKAQANPDGDLVWNHDQISGPDQMRLVLESIGDKAADRVDLKSVQPLKDLEAMADAIGTSSTNVSAALSDMAKTADQANAIIFAARKQQNAIANEIVKEAHLVTQGGDKARLNSLTGQLQSLQEALLPVRRAQGRGLRAWGAIADDSYSMAQVQGIIASGGNPAAIRQIVQSGSLIKKGFNAFMTVWTNGLLSSPATTISKVLGDTVNMIFKPTMQLGGSIATLDMPAVRQSISHFVGLYKGFSDSIGVMAKAFKVGKPILRNVNDAYGANLSGMAPKALGIDPDSTFGHVMGAVDNLVNLPHRFLITADEFAQQMNYRASVYAKSTRESLDSGVTGAQVAANANNDVKQAFEKGTGAANDPEALAFAKHATFQEDPGPLGQAVLAASNKAPVIRLVVPFQKILANLSRQGLEFGPGALLSTKWYEDIKAGGMRRKEAIGKFTLGTGASYLVATHVGTGDITGSGPTDPKLRANLQATGWQPYSVRVNGTYYPYSKLGHLGTMLGMVANLGERMGNFNENGKVSYAAHAASSFADAMSSQTFAQGFANFMDAMHDENKMQHFLQSEVSSVVPSIVNDIREGTDPTKRSPQDFGEAFMNRLPWMSKDVPSAYNTMGEKVPMAPGMGPEEFAPWTNALTPFHKSPVGNDPVLNEMTRLQRPFPAIPRFIKLNDVAVDLANIKNDKGQNAYDRANELLATKPSGGQTLHEALSSLIGSPRYQALSADVRPGFTSEREVELQKTLADYHRMVGADPSSPGLLDKEFPLLGSMKNQAKANQSQYRNGNTAKVNPIQNFLSQFQPK